MENQDFLEKLSRPRYRGGPEIRPVAGAGATPQLHYEGLKRGSKMKQIWNQLTESNEICQ